MTAGVLGGRGGVNGDGDDLCRDGGELMIMGLWMCVMADDKENHSPSGSVGLRTDQITQRRSNVKDSVTHIQLL